MSRESQFYGKLVIENDKIIFVQSKTSLITGHGSSMEDCLLVKLMQKEPLTLILPS